jgi:hypothetical protein
MTVMDGIKKIETIAGKAEDNQALFPNPGPSSDWSTIVPAEAGKDQWKHLNVLDSPPRSD